MTPATLDARPSRRRVWLILVGIMLSMALAALDQTIVGTAMPRVIAELNGMEHYAWVFTAYMLASTVVVPIYGKLSDIFGRRPFFMGAVSLFLLGSALSGTSQNMTQLILFRAIQGMGAGGTITLVQSIVGDIFPPRERGKWQGVTMSLYGLATIFGPALGGWMTDNWGWRSAFYVNLPVGALALAAVGIALPSRTAHRQHSIDWRGAGILVVAVVSLLLAFSWVGMSYEWLSLPVLGLMALSLLSWVVFFRVESRAPEPIINPALFSNRTFAISVAATFFGGAGMFSALIYPPLFVQAVIGRTATQSAAVLAPHMAAFTVSNILGGQMISRTGRYKPLALGAFMFSTVGMFLLSAMDMTTTETVVIRNLIIVGLGIGCTMPVFIIAVQNAFPVSEIGQVTSNLQFFRSIGSTMGTAVLGTILTYRFQAAFQANLPAALAQGLPPEQLSELRDPRALLTGDTVTAIQKHIANLGLDNGVFAQVVDLIRDSLATAISNVFFVSAVSLALGMALTVLLRELPLRTSHMPAETEIRKAVPRPADLKGDMTT